MSDKELLRSQLMAQMVEGKLSQKGAAERLGVTVRQVKRLKRGYLNAGVAALISKKRGQPSNRRTSDEVVARAMALVGARYADFGPTLAAEKLRQHNLLRFQQHGAGHGQAGMSERKRNDLARHAHRRLLPG